MTEQELREKLEKSFSYRVNSISRERDDKAREELLTFITQYGYKRELKTLEYVKGSSEEAYLGDNWWADEDIDGNSAYEVPKKWLDTRMTTLQQLIEKGEEK